MSNKTSKSTLNIEYSGLDLTATIRVNDLQVVLNFVANSLTVFAGNDTWLEYVEQWQLRSGRGRFDDVQAALSYYANVNEKQILAVLS